MSKCNTIQIDVDGLWTAIKQACLDVLNEVADKVIEAFQLEVVFAGAGKTVWRENAGKEFKRIAEDMAGDLVTVTVGINPSIESDAWSSPYAAQIMVALFGNHPPIFSQPGSEVWNGDMTGFRQSLALHVYGIPQLGWKEPGVEAIIDNAFKLTKVYFNNLVNRKIIEGINFYDYVYVT